MTTPKIEKIQTHLNAVRDKVAGTGRQTEHLTREARALKTRASDAFEDGVHATRREVTRRLHELEDLRDQAVIRVRKAPLAAVGATFAAGLVLGIVLGWVGHRPRRTSSSR